MTLFLVPAAILVGYGLLARGFPETTDFSLHVIWAQQYADALRAGVALPRWLDAYYNGYGGAVFLVYGRVFHLTTAILSLLTHNAAVAALLVAAASLAALGSAIYRLACLSANPRLSLIPAVISQVSPMITYQLATRQGLPELMGLAFLAWAFYFLQRAVDSNGARRTRYALGFVLLYVLTVNTHLITGFLGTGFVAVYVTLLFVRQPRTGRTMLAFWFLGLGLSASYLIPALYQQQFLHPEALIKSGLRYEVNFVAHNYAHDTMKPPPYYERSFRIDAIGGTPLRHIVPHELSVHSHTVTFVLFLVVLLAGVIHAGLPVRSLGFSRLASGVCIGVALFLSSYLSVGIWDRIWALQQIQAPFRWLVTATIPTFWYFGVSLGQEPQRTTRAGRLRHLCSGALFAFVAVYSVYDARKVYFNSIRHDAVPFAYYESKDFRDRWHTPAEHLPRWVSAATWRAVTDSQRAPAATNGAVVDVVSWTPASKIVSITASTPSLLTLPVFYYPNWVAHLSADRRTLPTRPDTDGKLSIEVPPGTSRIRLRFESSPDMYWSRALSGSLVAVWVVLAILSFRRGPFDAV